MDPRTGQAIDPFYPAGLVPGVTAAFKRFFHRHCELQILFDAPAGAAAHAAYAAAGRAPAALPWDTLRNVSNLLMLPAAGPAEGEAFPSVASLQVTYLVLHSIAYIKRGTK